MKSAPLTKIEPIQKNIDATHADINWTVFKKVIIREIAGVTKWELTQDVKSLVQSAESLLDQHIKFNCGINP